ncbi:MAG: FtsX-like permease family protein [Gemmatimonadales bacterium]
MSDASRAAAATAGWGLRAYHGTAVLLAIGGAVAVAIALPAVALGGGWAPALAPGGQAEAAVGHGAVFARSPEWLQAEAVRLLCAAFFGASAATFVVGGLGLLLVWAALGGERVGELAVRRAVGAPRRVLLAAWLVEGTAVAGGALAVGLPAGLLLTRWAAATWPGRVSAGTAAPVMLLAAAATLTIVGGAALGFIFAPRRRLSEGDGRPLGLTIPIAQLGLALVVLTAGALMARSAGRVAPVGSSGGDVFRAASSTGTEAERAAEYAALLQALRARGAYDTVSLAAAGAVAGLGTVGIITTECGVCPWGGLMVPQHSVAASQQFVSADSFQALGVRLVVGRGITDADDWRAGRVAVVSRALARFHFQDGEPIGRRLLLGDDPRTWYTVVGVVDVPPPAGLGGALLPAFTVYASVLQHPPGAVELTLRPRGPASVADPVELIASALGVDSRRVERTTVTALLAAQRAPVAWFGRWFALDGWASLLLALGGTVVQMTLWVRSLGPELGLRRALGASRARIVVLVLSQAALVGALGVGIGLCFGPAVWSALGTVVRGLPAWDTDVVLRYAAVLVSASTLAAAWPAWRASRRPPAILLARG